VRLQQIAFDLAKVLTIKWKEERGDSIPTPRLFSQMLDAANRFIDTRVECIGTRQHQDMAINPYFGQAVAMLFNAMEVVDDGGASQERPIIARGASGIRTTAMVNFHTGKDIDEEHVKKCHLNAAVFDSSWERQAAEILDNHDRVRAWVKNDRLGLVVPYRKDGVARKYLPDFVVEMTDGSFLIVEIKGQEGDAAIKKAAAERWCKAVTNDGRLGNWDYRICRGPNEIRNVLAAHEAVAEMYAT
jgi:type III restriction enzyme